MTQKISFLLLVSAVLCAVSCDSSSTSLVKRDEDPRVQQKIRVQITADGPDGLEIDSSGPIRVFSLDSGKQLGEFESSSLRVEPLASEIRVGTKKFSSRLRFTAQPGLHFEVRPDLGSSRRYNYRGVLDVLNYEGVLRVINELKVEEYLLGVVGKEMRGKDFSVEALKAQAIAARTFTLYNLSSAGRQRADYAFPSSTDFQSYGGASFETEQVIQAVQGTRGQVLTFGGKLFQSYYHSTCGGRTCSGHVFNERDIEPLKGGECGFCNKAPRFQWEHNIPVSELESRLRPWAAERQVKVGKILAVEPVDRTESGHSSYVRVRHSLGSLEVRADRLRTLLGLALPSARFESRLDTQRAQFVFAGKGYGHGVGLCQRGAATLASQNAGHGDILTHYFPGSGLQTVY